MKKILLFNLLAFTITLNAQVTFAPETIESGTFVDGVRTIEAADLDNDGDQDLVSAAINSSNVAYLMWYENDGAGNFTEHEISGNIIVANMRALKLIDIDGDGDIDILGSSDSRIINVRNNGDGTFTPLTIFNAPQISVIFGIDAADLDFDGDLDIIVPGRGAPGYLFWLRNDAGTFTEMPSLWNISNSFSVKAFDFDNDNDMDIIATRDNGVNSVRVFINDGTGSFTNLILEFINNARYIAIGDTNNDGTKEVFVSFTGGQIRNYTYDLVTDSWSTLVVDDTIEFPVHIKIADINDDGNQDVLVTSTIREAFYWLEGDGTGANFTPWLIDNDETTRTAGAIAMTGVDVDGDTDTDIIGAATSSDVITLYRNTTTLSIDDETFLNAIKIYPNPSLNYISIENQNGAVINKVIINDNLGRTVAIKTPINNTISIDELSSGTYFIKIYCDSKTVIKKFIKK